MNSPSPQAQILSTPDEFDEIERYCRRCKDCWPFTSEFWGKDSSQPDGHQTICKACYLERNKKVVCNLEPDTLSKKCSCCNKVKPLTKAHWHTRKESPDGFRAKCSECMGKVRKGKLAQIKALIAEPQEPFEITPETTFKACTCCGEEKPMDATFWHRCPTRGFRTQCKVCRNLKRDGSRKKVVAPSSLVPVVAGERMYGINCQSILKIKTFACRSCHVEKDLTAQYWSADCYSKTGFKKRCKACGSADQKRRIKKRQDALTALQEKQDAAA